jgi:hypothetical protein
MCLFQLLTFDNQDADRRHDFSIFHLLYRLLYSKPGSTSRTLNSSKLTIRPRLSPLSLPLLAEFCLVFGTRGPDSVRVIVGSVLGDFTTTGPGVIGLVGDFLIRDCSGQSGSDESQVTLRFGSAFGHLLANDVSIVAVYPDPPEVPLEVD